MCEPWSMRPREGLIPWLRRVIAGNLPVDKEIARLRQELELANARVDKAERDLTRACEAAWREGEALELDTMISRVLVYI